VTWFDTVRQQTLPGIWSQGVKIARTPGSVIEEARTVSEVTVRVRKPGDGIAPTVTLYLKDEEWTCDCGGQVDPCAHIAAAAVAVHQSTTVTSTSTSSAPTNTNASASAAVTPYVTARTLIYCLWSDPQGLSLSRELLAEDGTATQLRTSLNAPAARELSRELILRDQDLKLDRLIGMALGRFRLGPTLMAVIAALDGAPHVKLDGRRITVSSDSLLPRARVLDHPLGVLVTLDRPNDLEVIVGPGVGLAANTLRPLAETELSGLRWEKLPNRRAFSRAEFGELVTQVLPQLQRRMHVDILTDRLPGLTRRIPPSVLFDLSNDGDSLIVTAHIVYGKPPQARVEKGKLLQIGNTAPKRDAAAENDLEHQLRAELDLLIERPFHLQGVDAAHFSQRLKLWQQRRGIDAELGQPFEVVALVPELLFDGNSFDVKFTFDSADPKGSAPSAVVLRAFRDGLTQVPLANGFWGELPLAWLRENAERLKDLLESRSPSGEISREARVALAEFYGDLGLARPSGLEPYTTLLVEGLPEALLPTDLTAELRDYQKTGVAWLSAVKSSELGAILADDMGLGKTLQALSVLGPRTLVVCPRSVVHNWLSEAKRFRPTLRCGAYHGQGRKIDETLNLTITTYALLRIDSDELSRVDWDTIILDEAQAIKNPDSQAASAAYALRARFRLVLTGTPIENRLEELWSLMHFANRGLLGTIASFKARFSNPIANGDTAATARLRRLIRPFILRRHKSDVLTELPSRTDDILWVELDEQEREIYEQLRSDAHNVLQKLKTENNVIAALEALLRLRQASCHLGLLPNRNESGSAKLDRLIEAAEEAVDEGHRAIVFSQWTSLLSKIEPELRNRHIEFTRLDGSTRDRQSVVEAFQSDSGPPILLASLQAGGTGLNLTAADHVFLMDPWWNPAVEEQAASRAHRMGQSRPVFVHRMVAKDTVEERIIALQERKRSLGSIVDGADPTSGLTREDLVDLLQ
jgi:superfamily II DNA or RNA helicase